MKEYKVIEVKKAQAETMMNEMAKQGWEVVSTNCWSYWKTSIMVTFSREASLPSQGAYI